MIRRAAFIAALVLAAAGTAGEARAQAPLGVGLYTPEVPFEGPAKRYEMVRALAKHLSAVLGRPVEGKAFKSAGDLRRQIKARKIHFAVLGAVYLASQGQTSWPGPPLSVCNVLYAAATLTAPPLLATLVAQRR